MPKAKSEGTCRQYLVLQGITDCGHKDSKGEPIIYRKGDTITEKSPGELDLMKHSDPSSPRYRLLGEESDSELIEGAEIELSKLEKMSLKNLKALAAENNIDLEGATSKADVLLALRAELGDE